MNMQSQTRVSQHIDTLYRYMLNGGPLQSQWNEFNEYLDLIAGQIKNNEIRDGDIKDFRKHLLGLFGNNCLQGFALSKPHGYAGDYEIIDKIYTNHVSENPAYANWDRFFQNNSAPKAVRNRKEYFKAIIRKR